MTESDCPEEARMGVSEVEAIWQLLLSKAHKPLKTKCQVLGRIQQMLWAQAAKRNLD